MEGEGIEDEEVAGEAIREDDVGEGEEDLFERIEALVRASSFLRTVEYECEKSSWRGRGRRTLPLKASNGFMLSSYLFLYVPSSSSPLTTFEKPACALAAIAPPSSRYDWR